MAAGRKKRDWRSFRLPIPKGTAVALALALLAAGLSFLHIHQGTLLRVLTADRESLRENLTELEEINHTLRLEIAEAFSLPRIAKYATERLGMITPTTTRYVQVPASDE
ncbi:MAG: cell division protein FtsL [Candidatus Bipolaricaulia bacterium]